ncbi:MAG: hypothetical protein SFV24_21635 [Gemmatimonadales bacterium]|nr:hypothetical protein [Gemmatimonadota bacterium]MCC7133216.1 hypothetical protein [Gemmatimonadales bacterium]MDX2060427.1 hypothetical protein [Gemmatimonadales bacterium]
MPPVTAPTGPGVGDGWTRLVDAIRQLLPVEEIDGVWVFKTIRYNARDFGTAVLSRVDGDRRRIYTARYILTVKGKTRGQFESTLEEVGSGPLSALEELLALVPKRADDEEPPTAVPVEQWFPPVAAEVENGAGPS